MPRRSVARRERCAPKIAVRAWRALTAARVWLPAGRRGGRESARAPTVPPLTHIQAAKSAPKAAAATPVAKSKPAPSSKKSATALTPGGARAEQYQKLTLYEQILVRPDTYIGSIERVNERLFVYDGDQGKMVERDIEYVPGLFKVSVV